MSRVRPKTLPASKLMSAATLPGAKGRWVGEVGGAEQPLLLGGDEGEEDRSPRALRQRRERARQRQQLGAAGRVVDRAVVDRVALARRARRRRGGRGARCRRRPRRAASDRRRAAGRARCRSRCGAPRWRASIEVRIPSGTGRKSRCCGRLDELVEILARRGEQAARRRLGRPGLELDARLVARRQLELLAAPRGLHDLPRVAGRGGGVDDDRRRRALARGALVLVDPAAVVEAPLAGEERVVPVGVVVEHHEHLALQVDPLEVVPAVLRRLDAVADEDQLRVGEPGRRTLDAGRADVLLVPGEIDVRRAGAEKAHFAGAALFRPTISKRLLQVAVRARRLESDRLELRGEVGARELRRPGFPVPGLRAGRAARKRIGPAREAASIVAAALSVPGSGPAAFSGLKAAMARAGESQRATEVMRARPPLSLFDCSIGPLAAGEGER